LAYAHIDFVPVVDIPLVERNGHIKTERPDGREIAHPESRPEACGFCEIGILAAVSRAGVNERNHADGFRDCTPQLEAGLHHGASANGIDTVERADGEVV